jgi:hypothetical protein
VRLRPRTGGPGEGVPGGGPPAGGAQGGPPSLPGNSSAAGAGPAGAAVSKTLVAYLKAHQGKAAYLVAAVGSSTAGSIAVESEREAIDMGGFMGADPAPSLAKLRSFIDSGQLHYVLLSGGGGGAAGGIPDGRTSGGPGNSGSAASRHVISERDEWVEKHGTVVHVPGESSGGGGATLYYFAGGL